MAGVRVSVGWVGLGEGKRVMGMKNGGLIPARLLINNLLSRYNRGC